MSNSKISTIVTMFINITTSFVDLNKINNSEESIYL